MLPKAAALRLDEVLVKREFEEQSPKKPNERPAEFAYVFEAIRDYAPHTILDVGTGTTALPALMRNCGATVTAIDNVRDYWPRGMTNRHWHVLDVDIRSPRLGQTFDMVTCISVLEHIEPADVAVEAMVRMLNPGGVLVLAGPYNERHYIRNVYELPDAVAGKHGHYICQQFSRAEIDRWTGFGVQVVAQRYWRFFAGEAFATGGWIIPPRPATAIEQHDHTCLTLQKT